MTRMLGLHEMAIPYLERARRHFPGVRGMNIVRSGDPAEGILQVALEWNMDLVAMTTHAREGFSRWFLGSVAGTVVQRTQLPVLLKRPGVPARPGPIRSILVPLDESEISRAVLQVVKPLAARLKAEVILLHVEPHVVDPSPQWAVKGPLTLARKPLSLYQKLADGLEAEKLEAWPLAVEGNVAEEIVSRARELDVDLVAMATHGREGLSRALLGSVTRAVLKKSDRPLIVIRPTKGAAHE